VVWKAEKAGAVVLGVGRDSSTWWRRLDPVAGKAEAAEGAVRAGSGSGMGGQQWRRRHCRVRARWRFCYVVARRSAAFGQGNITVEIGL
jgi:hypothetical protein